LLAGTALAAASIRISPPVASPRQGGLRAELASALTALAVAGLGLVAGLAGLVLVILLALAAFSGGSASGADGFLYTPVAIFCGCVLIALVLLVRKARH
jgi:hypothetical protein